MKDRIIYAKIDFKIIVLFYGFNSKLITYFINA